MLIKMDAKTYLKKLSRFKFSISIFLLLISLELRKNIEDK